MDVQRRPYLGGSALTKPRHDRIGDHAPPRRLLLHLIAFAAAPLSFACGSPAQPPDSPTHRCVTTPYSLVECAPIDARSGAGPGR